MGMQTALGECIRQNRLRRHWSQQMLADKAGVRRTTVSAIESGSIVQPSGVLLRAIAEAFGKTIDDLMHESDNASLLFTASALPLHSDPSAMLRELIRKFTELSLDRQLLDMLGKQADPVCVHDWNNVLWCNNAAAELLGFDSPRELHSRPCQSVFTQSSLELQKEQISAGIMFIELIRKDATHIRVKARVRADMSYIGDTMRSIAICTFLPPQWERDLMEVLGSPTQVPA